MFGAVAAGIPSAGDIAWKAPVRLASVAALPAATYTAGPPAKLTATANGIIPAIDGTVPTVGDRVLLTAQAAGAENGIYVVSSIGAVGAPWVLTRASDADEAAELPAGAMTYVTEGATYAKRFLFLAAAVVTLGATVQTWAPIGYSNTIVRRVYLANATWTKPTAPNFVGVMARVQAGGGAGGGAVVTIAGQASMGGRGGGGGYSEKWLPAAALNPTEAVVVGAGGTTVSGGNGNSGGTSSFSTMTAVVGGSGGPASAATAGNLGVDGAGGGAAGSGGDLNVNGSGGGGVEILSAITVLTNHGGNSVLGPMAPARTAPTSGVPGGLYGGGGGGAANGASTAARAGSAGGAGVVVVDEYYSA